MTRLERRVLVLLATPRDGELTVSFLHQAGIESLCCATLDEVAARIEEGAGALIVASECLGGTGLERLAEIVRSGVSWSDLPVLLTVDSQRDSPFLARCLEAVSSLMVVDRPVRVPVLVSLVRSALMARERQYQVRDQLLLLESAQAEKAALLARERRARKEAEAANRSKSEFLASVSHEVRTPLNGLLGLLEFLLDSPLSREQRDWAQTMQSCATMMLGIVNDLLDLSRVEAGKLVLEETVFDPEAVVRETATFFLPQAGAKGLDLRVEISPAIPSPLEGPAPRLRQILSNLLNNALKFTRQGGVTIRLRAERGGLRFEVVDTGPGIPPEARSRIFSPFVQLQPGHGGAGLGLAISRRLIELMGGGIGVESQPGEGSTFWFWLPARPASRPAPEQPETVVEPAARPQVLVVDDNPLNRRVLAMQVEKAGYPVDVVASGTEALVRIERGDVGLVLLDCRLPDVDGFEVAQRVRSANLDPAPVLIAITAHGTEPYRERCLEAGMEDFLTKPISFRDLATCLHRWAARKFSVTKTN